MSPHINCPCLLMNNTYLRALWLLLVVVEIWINATRFYTLLQGPFLIVAPLSTICNWQREFAAWTNMNAVIYHGSQASRDMIRTYEFLCRDENVCVSYLYGSWLLYWVSSTTFLVGWDTRKIQDARGYYNIRNDRVGELAFAGYRLEMFHHWWSSQIEKSVLQARRLPTFYGIGKWTS